MHLVLAGCGSQVAHQRLNMAWFHNENAIEPSYWIGKIVDVFTDIKTSEMARTKKCAMKSTGKAKRAQLASKAGKGSTKDARVPYPFLTSSLCVCVCVCTLPRRSI
jgi:hypothetical protein